MDNRKIDLVDTKNGVKIEKTKLDKLLETLQASVQSIVIEDEKQFGRATELLKSLKDAIKNCETSRKGFIKPFNDFVKTINDDFKPVKENAEKIKKDLEKKILKYHQIIEQKRREAAEAERQRQIEEMKKEQAAKNAAAGWDDGEDEYIEETNKEIEKKIEEVNNQELSIKKAFKSGNVSTNVRKIWTYKIIDGSRVPVEYQSPDHKKIMSAINSGVREMDGVKIFEKPSLVSR